MVTVELSEEELFLIGTALRSMRDEFKSDPSPHEEDQVITNKYYVKVQDLLVRLNQDEEPEFTLNPEG